jgi:phospholipase C
MLAAPRNKKGYVMQRCILAMAAAAALSAPAQADQKFKHIIVVIQENRTPDNLFGSNPSFEPGVDIATSGTTSGGLTVKLSPVKLNDCYDISHTHASFEDAFTKGFDTEPNSAKTCLKDASFPQYKYVDNSSGTVQPYFDIATANGWANRMFQTNQGPSFPAHQFLFGGTSAPSDLSPLFAAENPTGDAGAGCTAGPGALVALIGPKGSEAANKPIYPCFDHPTLADLLDGAATPIAWRYYSSGNTSIWTAPNAIRHICVPAGSGKKLHCSGTDWVNDVMPNDPPQVLADIGNCKLAAVSWVIPTAAESDHAGINDATGPAWVASVINAVGNQTCGTEDYWKNTAIFIMWDDWGGWFDHVAPFKVVKPYQWGAGYTYGFRVPLLVVSAYTPPQTVSNAIFDFGSILAFIEANFGLGFIGASTGTGTYSHYADYQATQPGRGNLADFFTLTSPKPFTAIPASQGARYFLSQPKSDIDPDDD